MANILNTLYPPQIDTFMPAFVKTESCKVYFSISSYNNINDVQCIIISVSNQNTNESALKTDNYNKVLIQNWQQDDKGYYITISPSDMLNGEFNINQYYKVQIRFATADALLEKELFNESWETLKRQQWLLLNQEYFSEWSTVCLIKPISAVEINLTKFNSTDVNTFNKGLIHVTGQLNFYDTISGDKVDVKNESEHLESYYIQFLDADNKILLTSKTIYTSNNISYNTINTLVDLTSTNIENNTNVTMKVVCTTNNQYTYTSSYSCLIAGFISKDNFAPALSANFNQDNATVNITIKNRRSVYGILYVKRANSNDNYSTWETFYQAIINNTTINISLTDNTVESNIYYRYSVQLEDASQLLTPAYYSDKILCDYEDTYLTYQNKQLKLEFNYKISSMKPVVNRTKFDTLGSKYPKFAENGLMNYKQFSITGTMSALSDVSGDFLTKLDEYGSNYQNYLTYNEDNRITDYNDYDWEKRFREVAVKFLNDGKPKLYRSLTEGNMIVVLTDISLTPNATLSRMISDFSATVFEVADYSLENLNKFGIFTVPSVASLTLNNTSTSITKTVVGQLFENQFLPNDNGIENNIISSILKSNYADLYTGVLANKSLSKNINDFQLSNLKINFKQTSQSLYQESKNNAHNQDKLAPHIFDKNTLTLIDSPTAENIKNGLVGYVIKINGEKIFINERGFYQTPANVKITSIAFPYKDVATLDYNITLKEITDKSKVIKSSNRKKTIVGQYSGLFNSGKWLGESIRRKYSYINNQSDYIRMQYFSGISFDSEPYAVINIIYTDDTANTFSYEIGNTGILNLMNDYKIKDIAFIGKKMSVKSNSRIKFLDDNECVLLNDTKYSTINDVVSPLRNCVYNINGTNEIYYHNSWYDYNATTSIAKVPIQGLINYTGDIIRSVYYSD